MDRVRSWILEDSEVKPSDYDFKGEHLLDIRRAYQSACLLYGASPADWFSDIKFLKFSENDLANCSDTAPDQTIGWKKVLEPYKLSEGTSNNVEIIYGEGSMKNQMMATGILEEFAETVKQFNWPEPIIIHFDHCDRGASWSREKRRIMLCDDYVSRFIRQGEAIQSN
ncbi:MAG: DUF4344 domain-containing metallopeptidase [Gammaproteobacteria bacterium]|nr:DUF4344 domain-containing metallopeptidase [Gammaproteobacteria bacterium]